MTNDPESVMVSEHLGHYQGLRTDAQSLIRLRNVLRKRPEGNTPIH